MKGIFGANGLEGIEEEKWYAVDWIISIRGWPAGSGPPKISKFKC